MDIEGPYKDLPNVEEAGGEEYVQSHFREAAEFTEGVRRLVEGWGPTSAPTGPERAKEDRVLCERLEMILEFYQEQPHLLDLHLEAILEPLVRCLRVQVGRGEAPAHLYRLVYVITKVRGPKIVVKFFSHEVSDLEPTFELLLRQDPRDFSRWEIRYVLLLWLSILALVPFDLKRIDSSTDPSQTLVGRLVSCAKGYLAVSGKEREAAAILLSKLLTRPDVMHDHFASFVAWVEDSMHQKNVFQIAGTLQTLCSLFRTGQREDLLPFAHKLYPLLSVVKGMGKNNVVIRKLWIKLTQRLGLCFLKPRVAPWRYKRGCRILAISSPSSQPSAKGAQSEERGAHEEEDEDDEDLPDEIEDIIGSVLEGLGDNSTISRWSAAKGIGRLTERLPKFLADDVVGSVLQLLSDRADSDMWHGGCMALGELVRRGLLLPSRLSEVIPLLLKALQYDIRTGAHSVGSNVRDAACYVCWAFARAYEPSMLGGFSKELSVGLMLTALFDREVNCRRAASAAFQENVGRLGTFPNGLEILPQADYFALGNRQNAFVRVSCFTAQFEHYRAPIIDHLVSVKARHWDKNVRTLTSQALFGLVQIEPAYVSGKLQALYEMAKSGDLTSNHGALLCMGQIILSLSSLGALDRIPADHIKLIDGVIQLQKERGYFHQPGLDLAREGTCIFVRDLSLAHFALSEESLGLWEQFLHENINRKQLDLRDAAVEALSAFMGEYFKGLSHEEKRDKVDRLIQAMEAGEVSTKRGVPLALGALPPLFFDHCLGDVVAALGAGMERYDKGDAEMRQNCAIGLRTLALSYLGAHEAPLRQEGNRHLFGQILQQLSTGLEDYTIDSRGDVGSWKREACISGLSSLVCLIADLEGPGPKLLTLQTNTEILAKLLQQASEKIDKIRSVAGEAVLNILHHNGGVVELADKEALRAVLPRDTSFAWAVGPESYERLASILPLKHYTPHLLVGFAVAMGGFTEAIVKSSSSSFLKFVKGLPNQHGGDPGGVPSKECLLRRVAELFEGNTENPRVFAAGMAVLDLLLQHGLLEGLPDDLICRVLDLVSQGVSGSKDLKMLSSHMAICTGLVGQEGEAGRRGVKGSLAYLASPYPRIRRETAEALYSHMYEIPWLMEDGDRLQAVEALLLETSWDLKLQEIRPMHSELSKLLSPPPS